MDVFLVVFSVRLWRGTICKIFSLLQKLPAFVQCCEIFIFLCFRRCALSWIEMCELCECGAGGACAVSSEIESPSLQCAPSNWPWPNGLECVTCQKSACALPVHSVNRTQIPSEPCETWRASLLRLCSHPSAERDARQCGSLYSPDVNAWGPLSIQTLQILSEKPTIAPFLSATIFK